MTMTDLAPALAPKSDQLNADDLIAGPITITIAKVSVSKGEQPISISYEGDNSKPWKPCKSMGRVLMLMWGADGKAYTGRRVTLYRDPSVRFGPDTVGGIRISHMSDIDGERTVALTTTRGRRAPYTVKPLPKNRTAAPPSSAAAQDGGASSPAHPAPPSASPFALDPDEPHVIDVAPGASADEWREVAKALRGAIKRASTDGLKLTWLEMNDAQLRAFDARLADWVAEMAPRDDAA